MDVTLENDSGPLIEDTQEGTIDKEHHLEDQREERSRSQPKHLYDFVVKMPPSVDHVPSSSCQ